MEESTTDAPVESSGSVIAGVPVDDQGQALPVLDEAEQSTAAAATETETAEQSSEGAEALPETDDKLQKFAASHGLELDSPSARKAAKMAMDNQAEFQRNRQKATQMEKTMTTMSDESAEQVAEATGQDPEVLKRLQRMEVRDSIRGFWEENPEARQYEAQMAEIAVNSGLSGSPEAILKASYAMALSGNTNAVKSQASRETLEKLAHQQQAAVPRGNATNGASTSAAITPQNVDRMVANMSVEEYRKRLPEINAAMAG